MSAARASSDCDGGAHRHQPAEADYVSIAHPDAPVGHLPGNQVGTVGAVHAHEAAVGPVGEYGGAGTGAECEGSVEAAAISHELVAYIKPSSGGGPLRQADSHARSKHPAPPAGQSRGRPRQVDQEVRADRPVATEPVAREPTRHAVRKHQEPGLDPDASTGISDPAL